MSTHIPHISDANAPNDTVCAVVVTFNRQTLLRECLRALQNQTRAVDEILVVDNASTDGTRAMLAEEFPDVCVLALAFNSGGAGGFHDGMRDAFERGFDWLWIMDDDGVPASACLEKLLMANEGSVQSVLVPLQRDSGGREYGFAVWDGVERNVTEAVVANTRVRGKPVFHFVGPLISRAVVAKAGLPNADFFIWFDDIEWALRLNRRTKARVRFVPDAIFHHDFGAPAREVSFLGRRSLRTQQPAWKDYYGARNYLYALTRNRRGARDLMHYAFKVQLRGLIGDMMYEEDRWQRARMRLRGVRDGLLGRMGKRT